MPIYEFACPHCRTIFSFLSKRIKEQAPPPCPKCGRRDLSKQMSSFATPRGREGAPASEEGGAATLPDVDDAKMMRAMSEMERDMAHLDENNPKHMAHMMRKMKDMLPANTLPKDLDVAIKRLESGEDPEKIEADMGDFMGMGDEGGEGPGAGGGYSRDAGLYDY